MPSVERVQQELASAKSLDDFFGKEGIFARLFADTLEQMLEAELTAHLGYTPHAPEGRNSGNSRNGKRSRKLRTSTGDTTIQVPRDRNSTFQSPLLNPYQTSTNELEDKIIGLYAKGVSTRDIQATLHELYGVEVSAATISMVTDKVWGLVEASMNRPLSALYPIVYLDAILGHWVGDGAEGANFWLSVVTDLQTRGVEDIFIACIDGLTGFKDGIQAVFAQTHVQRCVIHQVRHSLTYIAWKDRKAFVADLKAIYALAAGGALGRAVCGGGALLGEQVGGSGDDVRLPARHSAPDLHDQYCGRL
jgi:putative transposase